MSLAHLVECTVMAEGDRTAEIDAEKLVVELFESAGYEVEESVGDEPGSVVRFARPRSGFLRQRTCWSVWPRCPEPLQPALDELDAIRQRHGAERALGIVAEGRLTEGYEIDLENRAVNAITLRRFALEITGVADHVRRMAESPDSAPYHPAQFLPRKLALADGNVDAVEYIEGWLRRGSWPVLALINYTRTGKKNLFWHVAFRRAQQFMVDPDEPVPLLVSGSNPIGETLVRLGWIVIGAPWIGWWTIRRVPVDRTPWLDERFLQGISSLESLAPLIKDDVLVLTLLDLDTTEIKHWYSKRLPEATYLQVLAAWNDVPEFVELASMPVHLTALCGAMQEVAEPVATIHEWAVRVALRLLFPVSETLGESSLTSAAESGALEQFALGSSRELARLLQRFEAEKHRYPVHWLKRSEGKPADPLSVGVSMVGAGDATASFTNRLIRDYFIARRIASEVRAGNLEILTRYQFPANYVLLYLAVLAPDVAARVTADRSEELRAQIQSDVEREVQLVLGHQLRRSVGALRMNIRDLQKGLPEDIEQSKREALRRIEEELHFLSNLAEQTRKWHELPSEPRESLQFISVLDETLKVLRDHYRNVRVTTEVSPDTQVMASRETLREILHCLLENAFHAVVHAKGLVDPYVMIRTRAIGQTVRIDVIDNGPGVPPANRERIFEPRVTTKKGGEQPLGTGMGLAIARRYAAHIGGRVELDAETEATCFYVVLVAGREDT